MFFCLCECCVCARWRKRNTCADLSLTSPCFGSHSFDALNHETSSQPLARQFALEQVKRLADELQARTAANCSDADTRTVANLHDTYEKVLELTIFHVFVAHGESEQARRLIEADQWLGEQKKQVDTTSRCSVLD